MNNEQTQQLNNQTKWYRHFMTCAAIKTPLRFILGGTQT